MNISSSSQICEHRLSWQNQWHRNSWACALFSHGTHRKTHCNHCGAIVDFIKNCQYSWAVPEREFIIWTAKTKSAAIMQFQNKTFAIHCVSVILFFFFFQFSLSCIPFCLICPANLIHSGRRSLPSLWSSPGKTRQLCDHRSRRWPVKDFPCCCWYSFNDHLMQNASNILNLKNTSVLER